MSLNRKLLLLVVVALAVIAGAWLLVVRALAADARDVTHADLRRAARAQVTLVDERLALLERRWEDVVENFDASNAERRDLNTLVEQTGDIERVAFQRRGEPVVQSSGNIDLKELFDRYSFTELMPVIAPESEVDVPHVVIGGPVGDDDGGTLLVEFSIDLIGVGDRQPLAPSEEILLVTTNERDQVRVIDRRPAEGPAIELPLTATERPAVQALNTAELAIVEAADYRDVDTLAAVAPVARTGWGVVLKIDESDVPRAQGSLIRWVSLLVLAVVSLLVVLGGWFIRSIAKRLATITHVARSLEAGELGTTINDRGDDELAVLAHTIDRLSTELQEDRSRRAQAEMALAHQARHDPLTGLPNRIAFMADLEAALEDQPAGQWAVLFCDLDGFKAVNDGMGHNAGDILLERTAARFASVIEDDVTLARFGGDEFLLLCPVGDGTRPRELAQRLEESLREPIEVGTATVELNASIGVALHENSDSADLLLRNADLAMYRVKQQRKAAGLGGADHRDGPYGAFGHDEELRRAIQGGEQLRLLYQPIVDLESGDIVGVEALVRWHHPALGLLNPRGFLPRADASGLLGDLDFWVLERACSQLAAWEHAGRLPESFVMSVNLSPAQLSNPGLREHIEGCLNRHLIDPALLQIEITEHSLVTDDVRVSQALGELKALGVVLAIDDFGTLYANLDRLRDLPADVLKIDQSFVRNLIDSPDDRAIVDAIVKMASALELRLVAEGIERVGQATILRNLGCRYGQGYYFGNPRSPEATAHVLTHGVVGITIDVTDGGHPGTGAPVPPATVIAPL